MGGTIQCGFGPSRALKCAAAMLNPSASTAGVQRFHNLDGMTAFVSILATLPFANQIMGCCEVVSPLQSRRCEHK